MVLCIYNHKRSHVLYNLVCNTIACLWIGRVDSKTFEKNNME